MLEVDPEVFFEYFRMTTEAFNELLARVAPLIQKRPQYMYIPPVERLALTLHFLATGSYQKFSGALFTIPQPTANGIIRETCEALWDELREENQPNAREGEWLNCKGDFSMVLLGMCDANYKFVYVSIGGRGRRHDAGLWKECDLYAALRDGTLPLPPPRKLPGGRVVTPPTIVGDGAFPLGPNLMTPFRQPQIVSDAERIYNYRLSRARRTIENAFGILSSRWRVLWRTFIAHEENARSIIKACVVLHNLLILNQENVPPQRTGTSLLDSTTSRDSASSTCQQWGTTTCQSASRSPPRTSGSWRTGGKFASTSSTTSSAQPEKSPISGGI
ncbi:Protein ALP1-like [Frankliniella fusca]|uniref:Protein ALP1-like n=1 Tax=Frankliniella fusca TaxID=407009 RepID=A0AAE1GR06_9NEOP|nr:Protein ALP1-like [Frankliniella fusca]